MQWDPRRDYEAGGLDLGPNDVRDTYGSRQDDIALQAQHASEIEREELEASMPPKSGLRGLLGRIAGVFRRS